MYQTNKPLTISAFAHLAQNVIENELGYVWLTGEITGFSKPVSGHWYFSLKDQNAEVRAAMFRGANYKVNFQPKNGMQVLVYAKVSFYAARGTFQLIIEKIQQAGEGLLQQRFEALKGDLSQRGYFDPQRKKPLPKPQKIGIVTSPTGAALQDILNVLQRRDPSLQVVIYPTLVQGNAAAVQIAEMIQLANLRNEVDLLIVGRGGGSLEDLWCFNEEIVAEAIFRSKLPIVSAVGHEVDFTIADFVADVRAATPSVAAEIVSVDHQERLRKLQSLQQRLSLGLDYCLAHKKRQIQDLTIRLLPFHPEKILSKQKQQLLHYEHRLIQLIQNKIHHTQNQLQQWQHRLGKTPLRLTHQQHLLRQWQLRLLQQHPQKQLQQKVQRLEQLSAKLFYAMDNRLQKDRFHFEKLTETLDHLSPLKVLNRGYSITLDHCGNAVKSVKEVKIGDKLMTRVEDGVVVSEVVGVK